jgi:DNA-binding NarL/FixJ family response regulator
MPANGVAEKTKVSNCEQSFQGRVLILNASELSLALARPLQTPKHNGSFARMPRFRLKAKRHFDACTRNSFKPLPPKTCGRMNLMKRPSTTSREHIRVLVADSNQTQSDVLSSALRRQRGLKITCCRGERSYCLEALRSAPVDVVLLGDGSADHDDLIEALRVLHASYPHVGLILLLDSYDRNLVVNALRAGARGLFGRAGQSFRALCRCIAVVHQDQFWANTEQMGYIIDAISSTSLARVINAKGEGLLSPREEQVVSLVAEGTGNREIAQQLDIKENTVKKSLMRIYDKLGVSNRVELVLYALTHHGVEKSPFTATLPAAPEPLAFDGAEADHVNLLGGTPKAN